MKIYYSTIHELSTLVREQKVSPVEIVEACLSRIEKLNPKLNAFITVLKDEALEEAQQAEIEIKTGNWRGPLHGIPVGIKDFYDTAGIKTTAAFEHFKDRVPTKDAVGVAKLKEAGAIIIGKTNMHKLGMGTTGLDSYFGPVHNPWNSEYIPGGSSSGSAAAVASGMCYATFDTDAIGSCRLPAACCGVVGFKGTYGLISPKGILEGEEPPDELILWLNHPGITARSVEDIALVLDILAERNQHTKSVNYPDEVTKERKLRVGIANNFKVDEEVLIAFEKAAEIIRGFDYPMSEVAAPFWGFSQGISTIEADRKAIEDDAFKDVDVLLLPTIPTTTPSVKEVGNNPQALSAEHTVFVNYYGLPAISVPCGFDKSGLPLGLQIVGMPWDESAVLRLAHQYQMEAGHGKNIQESNAMRKNDNRKTIRGKGWKRPYNISSDKYAIISKAILKVLTSKPVKFGELVAKVEEEVGTFPGSVEWYTLSSLRELESEGKVIRSKGKIATYYKT